MQHILRLIAMLLGLGALSASEWAGASGYGPGQTVTLAGVSAYIKLPLNPVQTPIPLVIFLGGSGTQGRSPWDADIMAAAFERRSVYPAVLTLTVSNHRSPGEGDEPAVRAAIAEAATRFGTNPRYMIAGFSAGGQYSHRFLFHVAPQDVIAAAAVNPGSWTMPTGGKLEEGMVFTPQGTSADTQPPMPAAFNVPLLALCSTDDTTRLPIAQRFYNEAVAAGMRVSGSFDLPGGHSWSDLNKSDKVADFFISVGRSTSTSIPAITAQPADSTVFATTTATFSVTAAGTPAPTYQWQSRASSGGTFANIAGAVSASYTTPATTVGQNGMQFRVVVTNSVGSVTSNTATLTVNTLTLRNPEGPISTIAGLAYSYYTVTTDGTIPNLAALTPAATGTVTTFDLSPRTRNDNIAFSFNGYLSVPTDGLYTFFTNSDDGSRLMIGTTTVVDNDGPHAMQERSGAIGLKAGLHAITVLFAQGVGGYGLEVRWEGPGIAKNPIPGANLFRATTAPTITGQPTSRNVTVGATATFIVTASGTPAPTYQWQRNNVNISGATSASYTTPAAVLGDNGSTYRCVVTNSAGSATSTSATLTVTAAVVIPTTPAAPTVSGAGTATPTLSGMSDASATMRIYDGATLIGTVTADGTGAWSYSPTLSPGTHQITVTASNSAGTSPASPAVSVVIPATAVAPTITAQPTGQSAVVGGTATFSVSATGTPAPTYQWQRNLVAISGATSATYTTPATVIGDHGATYRCVVTNSAGSVTSNAATLTVTAGSGSGSGSSVKSKGSSGKCGIGSGIGALSMMLMLMLATARRPQRAER